MSSLVDYSRALELERQHDFVRAREHYLRAFAAGLRSPASSTNWPGLKWNLASAIPKGSRVRATRDRDATGKPDVLDTYGWALHSAGRHEKRWGLAPAGVSEEAGDVLYPLPPRGGVPGVGKARCRGRTLQTTGRTATYSRGGHGGATLARRTTAVNAPPSPSNNSEERSTR